MITPDENYEAECREQAEDEGERYPVHFNFAVETLLTDFYIVGDQVMDLTQLGGHLKENDVWDSAGTVRKQP